MASQEGCGIAVRYTIACKSVHHFLQDGFKIRCEMSGGKALLDYQTIQELTSPLCILHDKRYSHEVNGQATLSRSFS